MSRPARTGLALAAIVAAGGGGYWAGHRDRLPAGISWVQPILSLSGLAAAQGGPTGPIIYYRDPDGRPTYAATPAKTAAGRDFVAVHASEDVGFDDVAPKAGEARADKGGKPILYYRNPMGLPDTSSVPKKDSMGMDYIAVRAGEDDDDPTVTISPGKLQRSGVRSEPAMMRVLSLPVRAPGTIQLDERRIAVVSLRTQGFIEKVEAVTTGEVVRKGQPLMRVYAREIAAAAAQYVSVDPRSSSGGALPADGARRRLENLDVPADFIAEIERTRKVPATVTWPAPRDGIVVERTAIEGMMANAGDVMFRVADASVVWALVDVAERELPGIKVGQMVSVRPRSQPNRSFSGKVALIYPQINRETRSGRIRIELANPDAALLPDMYVEAEIAIGGDKAVVAVPTSAVIDSGTRQVVILDKGQGRFEPRQVTLGQRGDGYVEIRQGIGDGDPVVVSANFLIDAESNLKAALRGLNSVEQAP